MCSRNLGFCYGKHVYTYTVLTLDLKQYVSILSLCFKDHLLKEGLAWLDSQSAGEAQYWLPALFSELSSRDITPEEASQMTP